MKISYSWLTRYLDLDLTIEEISGLLTGCGLEVESTEKFETVKGSLEGILIGKVISCEKHPNADKLSLTTVEVGREKPLSVVCGAPNVAKGQKVLVATVGTTLYNGNESFIIKDVTIRGAHSEGMICAEDELGLGTSHEGIMVLPEDAPVGTPANQYLDVFSDTVFEIGLTPNRSDAFSHTGVARDLRAVLRTHYPEKYRHLALKWPETAEISPGKNKFQIPVTLEDPESCPRYSGLTFKGVTVGESPTWMQNLLKAGGMRPINNIVDITNFILLETGQPLHAFDADKIKGGRIVVKRLPAGTSFTTLDGIQRKLSAEDLMICNAEEGMCMAGVYGGLDSGVTPETTRIFLESAYFNPVTIRKTSRYHGLKTDSAQRFERGANPEITIYALKRAAQLFTELAGAEVSSEIQDVYPKPVDWKNIQINYKNVDRLIGKTIPREAIKNILLDLEIVILEETSSGMQLSVPSFKTDVEREADVIEEILRIYGYNNIGFEQEIRYSMVDKSLNDNEKTRNRISDFLSSHGFSEIMCNSLTRAEYKSISQSLVPENYVHLLNPLSKDLEVMRQTLLFGGLETIAYNQNRRINDLKLYEYGSVYQFEAFVSTGVSLDKYREEPHFALLVTGKKDPENWQKKPAEVDFYYLKSIINSMLTKLGVQAVEYTTAPSQLDLFSRGLTYSIRNEPDIFVELGEVTGKVLKAFDLKTRVYFAAIRWKKLLQIIESRKVLYSELPRFPWVRRDLALLLDKEVSYELIEQIAYETEKKLLKKVSLFDIYEGKGIEENKKSYAVSFILQDDQKTLTDEEIDGVMNRLIKKYAKQLGASTR
ncbi:MAG: phenylalanine--tRNA ligase subunit beta [Bacteroidetes bacterium]|nr:phenylalanine--tRNA ligase subunit beta [Bacteroidota bacterium]